MKNYTKLNATFGDTSRGEFMYQEIRRNEQRSEAANRWGLLSAVDRFMATRGMARRAESMDEDLLAPARLNRARRTAAAVLQAEYSHTEGLENSKVVEI